MPPWAPWGGPSKRRGTTMGESTSSPARKVRTRRPMSWSGPQPKHWWKRLPGSVYRISSREPNTGSNGAGSAGSCRTGFLSDGIGHVEVFLEKGLPGDEGARGPAPLFGPVVPASETYRVSPPWMGDRALRQLGALQRVRELVDPLLPVLARGGRAHGVHQPIGHRSHVMEYTRPSVVHHPRTGKGDAHGGYGQADC